MSSSDKESQPPIPGPGEDDEVFDVEEEQTPLVSASLQDIHKILEDMNNTLELQQQRHRDEMQELETTIDGLQNRMEGFAMERGEGGNHHQHPHRGTNKGSSLNLFSGVRRRSDRHRRYQDRTKYHYLEEDVFSLMMMNNAFEFNNVLEIRLMTGPWFLGMVTFGVFQIGLGSAIIYDQWINTRVECEANKGTAEACLPFNIPLRVGAGVIYARYAAVMLVLATQTDVLSSIQTMLLLKSTSSEGWDKIIGEEGSGNNGSIFRPLWIVRILIPNMLKLIQAIVILFTSFIIIIQSETIVDLLKDFTAVLVISHADNLMFYLAVHGYFGNSLKRKAIEVQAVHWEIDTTSNSENDDNTDSGTRPAAGDTFCGKLKRILNLRVCILGMLCMIMIGGVTFVVRGQYSGRWIKLRYPQCKAEYLYFIGDGVCSDFAPYNTEKCGFDGGDCERNPVNGYPNCFVHEPDEIGDGRCYERPPFNLSPYNSAECGWDGGDCERNPVDGYPDCFVHDLSQIGNGGCHDIPPYNTEECGFDGGDCDLYNSLTDCHVDKPWRIGDGYCDDFPPYNTAECGFDGGDCL